jgi:hypothetical protein
VGDECINAYMGGIFAHHFKNDAILSLLPREKVTLMVK